MTLGSLPSWGRALRVSALAAAMTAFVAIYGANFADDAGNVLMGFEYSSRGEVRSRDRDWQREIWEDRTVGANFFAPTETAYVTEAGNLPSQTVANNLMPCRTATNVSVATGQQFFTNFDATGSLWKFQPDGSSCFTGSTILRASR